MRKNRISLEDHATIPVGFWLEGYAVEEDAALVDRVEEVDAAQQGGLAAAARADEAHDLVLVERQVKHALYGKYIRRSTKLHAHDADNACNEGDIVRVAECAPMSKTKNWRVVEVVARTAK